MFFASVRQFENQLANAWGHDVAGISRFVFAGVVGRLQEPHVESVFQLGENRLGRSHLVARQIERLVKFRKRPWGIVESGDLDQKSPDASLSDSL